MTGDQGARNNTRLLPQPVLEALLEDRLLPVVGAGFSLNALMPAGRKMPLWWQLGEQVKSEVEYLTPNADAVEVLSAYAAEHGRQALVARLRRALHDGFAAPGSAHLAFARLPFTTVVTTNFDPLLEDAYRAVRRPFRVVIREDQLASPVPGEAVTVVKAHGDYDNEPVLVATEEDYDAFLLTRPLLATHLANLLITRLAFLVGYSLSDSDWRQLLTAVRSRLGRSRQKIYAVEVDPSPATVERFRRRDVTVIPLRSNGRTTADTLEEMFNEMRSYAAEHGLEDAIVRDEGALEELRVTGRADRRLVLFLVPERLLAFYREQVFPALRAGRLNPITVFDVDARGGGSTHTTTLALIEQSVAIVADATDGNSNVMFELGLATTTPSAAGRVAIISRGSVPSEVGALESIPFISDAGHEPFLSQLLAWLNETTGGSSPAPPRDVSLSGEPQHDPGWLVVRAFRDLEMALRQRYERDQRVGPVVPLLRRAIDDGVISADLASRLDSARRLRNEVLHLGVDPDADEAITAAAAMDEATKALEQP